MMENESKPEKEYFLRTERGNSSSFSSNNPEMSDGERQFVESMDYYENTSSPEIIEYMEKAKPITREDWFE
jgi:hypothetical protein